MNPGMAHGQFANPPAGHNKTLRGPSGFCFKRVKGAFTSNMAQTQTHQDDLSNFEALLEASYAKGEVKEGEIAKGTVVHVGKDHVVVDIGYKSEGQIPLSEFQVINGVPNVKAGDAIDVLVESRENDNGLIVLSKEKADKLKVWDDISAAACERDEAGGRRHCGPREGRFVRRHWRQGVFAWFSQVDLRPIRNLDKLIGEKFTASRSSSSTRSVATLCSPAVVSCWRKSARTMKKETLKKLAGRCDCDGRRGQEHHRIRCVH
jgi:small subunit ribosomal protein S1